MDPMDRMVLVSLVKPQGRRWPLEAAIVTRLAQLRGGGWCWATQAAEWTGADEVACRRALKSLEERRIIRRDPGDGPRPDHIRWCAVNDDWRRWRVEWLLEPSQIAAQLALAAQQREESPLTRIFARSYSARSVARIARSYDARSWAEDMELMAGIARHGNARSQDPREADRALLIARSVGRRRAVLERAILGDGPQEGSTSEGNVEDPPASQEEERVITGEVRALAGRIVGIGVAAPGKAKFLNGRPLWQLQALVEDHGADTIRRLVDSVAGQELSPLRIVELVAQLVALEAGEHPPLQVAEPINVAAKVANLEQLVATYKAAGAEPPTEILDELARWQDDGAQVFPEEAMA